MTRELDAGTFEYRNSEEEFGSTVLDSIDRMQDEGGVAPDLSHQRSPETLRLNAERRVLQG